ncbi:putative rho GTPase-activating protein 21-like [Apostichopus japonicus]|uniref:Putative rho GTPase-activating protein 21-like n=1 Tax=Stichopus japonicus TaxID=307972 RepID=A0A2G8LQB7_STIJA|nr:putative rho GTPase-activating protein 21-like [Apostichopus japonicus]
MDTIFVKQVREGSPADKAGLNAGDRIVSVDGENISGKKYQTVVDTIQSRNTSVVLEVVPKSDDILQVAYPSSSLRSPREKSESYNTPASEMASPTLESEFLSDDDILIVGGSPEKSAHGNVERTEIQLPIKSDSSVPKYLVSVPDRTDGNNSEHLVILPKDGTIEIQGLKTGSPSRKLDFSQGGLRSTVIDSKDTRASKSDLPSDTQTSKHVYPQRPFRLTGVLGSPGSKGSPGRAPHGAQLQCDSNPVDVSTSSPVGKYRQCVNVLPNKPVLVKVETSHITEERGDIRTTSVPTRLQQGRSPQSGSVTPERLSTNSNVINISNSNDGQVRIRVKDPFYREHAQMYSHSTSGIDQSNPSMIVDASQPSVKLSKSRDKKVLPDNSADVPPVHSANRKYSDPIAVQRAEKLKPFHNLDLASLTTPRSGEAHKTKHDDTDGRIKKFLFQTTATIDIKDHNKKAGSSKEAPPAPVRSSSRGRVRERSLERDKKKEKTFLDRKQRSRSYDRNYHRKNARNQSIHQHTIYAEREQETQLLRPPRPRMRSRKDSDPTSPSHPTSPSPESKGTADKAAASKSLISRRTSYLKATKTEDGRSEKAGTPLPSNLEEIEHAQLPEENSRQTTVITVPALSIQKPRDLNLEAEGESSKTPSEGREVIKEGLLFGKWNLKDGRSWRTVWAKLINNSLYLYRENRDSAGNTSDVEAHPVDIDQAMVDIAYDYIKKKNVFRLCTVGGSDYLFCVSDKETMLSWIECIQSCRNSGGENKHVINEDLLLRRAQLHAPRKPVPLRTPSPNESNKRASSRRHESKDASNIKQRGSQRHSKKTRKKPLPPNQEELDNDSLTFGIPLEYLPTSSTNEFVPLFLEKCCSIVETFGLDVVGVYRVPGNTGGIGYLKSELQADIRELDFRDERWRDVNVISSLLKYFFRKLPNPLIPSEQYSFFIQANRTKDPAQRMANIRREIHNLPEHHFAALQFLIKHLKLISNNCSVNKMEVRNLAIVFGPTLIRTADDNMVQMVQDMSDQCKIVESVIEHCDWFFCEDVESQQNIPHDALPGADIMTDANVLLTKAREDKRNNETISPKDIVASVLSAANRKLKKPDRRSIDASKDTDEKDGGQSTTSSNSKASTRGSSRTESQSTEADSGRTLEDNSPNSKRTFHNNSKDRHQKGDGTANWIIGTSPRYQWKQTEYSKEREIIEQKHKLAVQDYEKEESTNLEEIFRSKERLKDFCSSKTSAIETVVTVDTQSVTSDYSTTSSNNNNCFTDHSTRTTDRGRKSSTSLTPDSNVSSEDSEFFRSITAAYEVKYQSLFNKESDESSTLVGEESENSSSVSGTEQRPDNFPRSKSFTSGQLLACSQSPQKSDNVSRPTSLGLGDRRNSLKLSAASQSLLVSPRSPQKKTKIEVTIVYEKSEVTPQLEKKTKCHSLESSPEKKQALSPAARKEKNRQQRRRRHTLGGPNEARNSQKIVEITLVGEHTTTKSENASPVRRLKSSQSFGKASDIKEREKRRNCSSNPNLIDGVLDGGKSLTLPPKKKPASPTKSDKDYHPQKLNTKQEFFEIQAAL